MSLESLELALAKAKAILQPSQPDFSSFFEDDGVNPRRFLPKRLIDPVVEEIKNTPEILEFSQSWLGTFAGGGRLSEYAIAVALVHRLFAKVSPKTIVLDLLDLARAKTCKHCTYVGLHGDGIGEKIEIGEGVSVMPANAAPPSREREYIFGINRLEQPVFDFGAYPIDRQILR